MTSNREKRAFWYFVLTAGLTFLIIPMFGDGRFMGVGYAGAALILASTLRIRFLKAQRRAVATRRNAGH
jgi:hypothetical protein